MSMEKKMCPACGEPVEAGWKICPACETPLAGPACPGCGRAVKENWKRCPECEVRLICPVCGKRLTRADDRCEDCAARGAESPQAPEPGAIVIEPVTGMEFVYVPAGKFLMGDTFGEGIENEQPVHRVRMSGFFLGRTPATQEQWQRLMKDNPSGFQSGSNPVENVVLDDVHAFIEALSAPVKGSQFLLPTEAQWEYAARSGGREELYAGGDSIDALAWYGENSGLRPRPVGGRKPNGLGLYDMSGNVWEWCRDGFVEDAYEIHTETDPVIPDTDGLRVIRGGSWNLDAWSARCARRFSFRTEDHGPGLGFRLVMVQDAKE